MVCVAQENRARANGTEYTGSELPGWEIFKHAIQLVFLKTTPFLVLSYFFILLASNLYENSFYSG